MLNKKLSVILLVLVLSMTFLVVGCSDNQEEATVDSQESTEEVAMNLSEEEKEGGVFYGRVASDPPTLDPADSTDTTSSRVIRNIFDGLVQYDEKLNVVPAIAKDWKISEDNLTWTFNLKEGVKFHNGREVTAEDFVYSFTRILDPTTQSKRQWLFESVAGAEEFMDGKVDSVKGFTAIDKYTFEIKLARPFTPFLSVLAMENAAVLPKEAIEEYGEEFAQNPVGAGPFKFVEWKHDSEVVLEKNEDYYVDGKPYLDKVVYRVIVHGSSAFPEYEQGNIYEMDSDIPDGQLERVMDPSGEFSAEYESVDRLGTYYIGMNTQEEPFNNKKVRQAVNYAINKKIIAGVLRNGTVNPAYGILPPQIPGHNPDIEGYKYNPEKAKELLAEAGYPDGLPGEYELVYNTSKSHQRIAEAIQANLKKVGINLTIRNLDWGTYIDKVDKGETQMFRLAWIADYPDPDNFLYVLFHSDNAGPGGNGAFYNNPEVDRMLEKGRSMAPGAERVALYQELEKKIVEDAPWATIYYYSTPVLVKPFVHNYVMTGQAALPLTNIWLDPDHR